MVPISGLLPSVDHCLVKNDGGVGGECDDVAVVMVTNMKVIMTGCLCEIQMMPAVNAAMCQVPQMPYGMYTNYQPQVHVRLLSVVSLTCRVCRSRWLSGRTPDCGARGPRFESHRVRSCLSRQSLRYTALGTGCAPLLQCLGRLSLPPSVGR